MPNTQVHRLTLGLGTISVVAGGLALVDVFSSGISLHLGSMRISTRDAVRPFIICVLAGSAAIWLADRQVGAAPSWTRARRWSAGFAFLVALFVVLEGIRSGIFVAGGADAYGYVTQASLWANLRLRVQEPLAAIVPSLGPSVAPLG